MLTPEEITALLDLPESARAKLAAIPGPGWLVARVDADTPTTVTGRPLSWIPRSAEYLSGVAGVWAWCPADTFAIVQACGGFTCALDTCVDGGFDAAWSRYAHEPVVVHGATPRLAALRLLATSP